MGQKETLQEDKAGVTTERQKEEVGHLNFILLPLRVVRSKAVGNYLSREQVRRANKTIK